MGQHVVGTVDDLQAEGQRIVVLEGRSIGVFYRGGEWFALRNVCPHHGAELCRGIVSGTTRFTPDGEFVYDMEGRVLRCPWHGFEFDLATGRSLVEPDRMRVRTYSVEVDNGDVIVTI